MLLALWFDFWNLADWVPQPPTPPASAPPTAGGHRKKKREYQSSADYEWWEEYERTLKRLHPVEVSETAPEVVQKKAAQANRLIEAVKTKVPPSKEAFQRVAAKIVELSSQIKEFELQSRDEEDALLVLLL